MEHSADCSNQGTRPTADRVEPLMLESRWRHAVRIQPGSIRAVTAEEFPGVLCQLVRLAVEVSAARAPTQTGVVRNAGQRNHTVTIGLNQPLDVSPCRWREAGPADETVLSSARGVVRRR